MKRSARILQLAKGNDQNKENSSSLFDSTYNDTTPGNKEKSDSSANLSDTDSSYNPPALNTTFDESSMEDAENISQDNSVHNLSNQSFKGSLSSQKEILLSERIPLSEKRIESSKINTFSISDDSLISHISNSSRYDDVAIESRFIKPLSSLLNKKDEPVLINNDAGCSKYETQGDDCTDENTQKRPENKKNVIRNKDYCFYCESLVLNFARHLLRHHIYEPEVQKILSKPKKSLERKRLITDLRKKGNFIQNSVEVTKPMRKQMFTDYLPCPNCLGFYSKKLLWKHKKKCTGKSSTNVQSEAQNLLIRHLKIDQKLKDNVFPRMRADKVSLVAKSDLLICAFGSQYLKTHRETHYVNVVSRKMRELAKLLLELKKLNPSIKDFFDALRPKHYDDIVAATKVVGKYDIEKERYETPTFAMNISTSIKQCCNLAIMFALKKQGPYMEVNTADIESDLKTFIQIIDSNWKFDVSSQAATDLNKKKWNKVTIIPLANDLKIFKNYLSKKAEEAALKIKKGTYNISTYIELLETIYCRVLLLNRRRPGELQRIKVHDYLDNDKNISNNYEEFDRALTASERILVKKFKRVVIRGKRDRGVPVLFNIEVQDDIKLLLSIRDRFVSTSNKFIFGNPGYNNTIYGYKVVERLSRLSGAKNPTAISSTRLRKHLATLSQIFSMSENDIEQLATFMGHTNEIHKKSYRLPDDIYQTAKISKLLILMENGMADVYRGKSLDEIDLDLNEELDEGITENKEILDFDSPAIYESSHMSSQECEQQVLYKNDESQPGPSRLQNSESDHPISSPFISKNIAKKGKKRILVPWTADQKKVVTTFFKRHIKNRQPPKRNECDILKEKHPDLLLNKDWLKIKVFVQNIYAKK